MSTTLSFRSALIPLALAALTACGGGQVVSSPSRTTEATLLVRVPCVTPPCTGDDEDATAAPVAPGGRPPVSMLALGHQHSCALTEDGAVHCWGDNHHGQLGDIGEDRSEIPSVVPSLPPMAAVWSGYDGTCARTADDARLFCWGDTGLGDAAREGFANALPFRGVRYVALGYRKGCFLDESGALYCWGDYGRPRGPVWEGPQRVRVDHPVAVALGYVRGCATRADGRLSCWGQPSNYVDTEEVRGGDRLWTLSELHEAAQVVFTESPQALPLVLSQQGRLYQVELGASHGHGSEHHLGRRVYDLDGVVQIAAGGNHYCARSSSGSAWCWGNNHRGQVGDGSEADRRDEPRPLGLDGVLEVATGSNHSCARTDQGLYCWGDNARGQIGAADVHHTPTPTALPW